MTVRLVYWLVLALAAIHVAWRGGAPERWALAIYAVASALTPLLLSPLAERFRGPEWSGMLVDLANYGAFLVLAVVANRFWPLWISAMQGVALATHMLGLFHEKRLNLTYALFAQMWAYPIIALIVIGAERHRRRLARTGSDRSWKTFSGPSTPAPRGAGPRGS